MKNSVTYIYSNQDDVALYLQYLVDKVRQIETINFVPVCIEEYKITPKAHKKLKDELEDLIEKKEYDKAADKRANLQRIESANRYLNLSPLFIFQEGTEDEVILSGSKKSLSRILDAATRITDAANFMQGVDFSGFGNTLQTIINVVTEVAAKNNDAGEGLETTQKQTSVT